MLSLDPTTHVYYHNNQRVPGVNEVLSCIGRRAFRPEQTTTEEDDLYSSWTSLSGQEFFNDPNATEFGTHVHSAIRFDLLGIKAIVADEMKPWMDAYRAFRKEHGVGTTIESKDGRPMVERSLYSERYGYAGTLDWVAEMRERICLVDWKTSEAGFFVMPTLAIAAYAQLFREEMGVPFWPPGYIVNLQGDGNFRTMPLSSSDMRSNFNRFLSALNVYRMRT